MKGKDFYSILSKSSDWLPSHMKARNPPSTGESFTLLVIGSKYAKWFDRMHEKGLNEGLGYSSFLTNSPDELLGKTQEGARYHHSSGEGSLHALALCKGQAACPRASWYQVDSWARSWVEGVQFWGDPLQKSGYQKTTTMVVQIPRILLGSTAFSWQKFVKRNTPFTGWYCKNHWHQIWI